MKNFIQDDDIIEVTAPAGGVSSGDGVLVGNLFGVACATVAAGGRVNLATEGVFELPKLNTAVIAEGAKVSWDSAAHRCDAPGTGLYPIGVAVAAGNGATSVKVRLDGVSTAAAA